MVCLHSTTPGRWWCTRLSCPAHQRALADRSSSGATTVNRQWCLWRSVEPSSFRWSPNRPMRATDIVEPEPAQARDLAKERTQRGVRSIVALRPFKDLFICAKHLFSAARGALGLGALTIERKGAELPDMRRSDGPPTADGCADSHDPAPRRRERPPPGARHSPPPWDKIARRTRLRWACTAPG
jgi:hypothetical protein